MKRLCEYLVDRFYQLDCSMRLRCSYWQELMLENVSYWWHEHIKYSSMCQDPTALSSSFSDAGIVSKN